jgi:hypothetical protein
MDDWELVTIALPGDGAVLLKEGLLRGGELWLVLAWT